MNFYYALQSVFIAIFMGITMLDDSHL